MLNSQSARCVSIAAIKRTSGQADKLDSVICQIYIVGLANGLLAGKNLTTRGVEGGCPNPDISGMQMRSAVKRILDVIPERQNSDSANPPIAGALWNLFSCNRTPR